LYNVKVGQNSVGRQLGRTGHLGVSSQVGYFKNFSRSKAPTILSKLTSKMLLLYYIIILGFYVNVLIYKLTVQSFNIYTISRQLNIITKSRVFNLFWNITI